MAEVFLVTAGAYSDYCVIGAFSTRDRAESYIAARKKNGNMSIDHIDVEAFEMDVPEEQWKQTRVDIDRHGVVHHVETTMSGHPGSGEERAFMGGHGRLVVTVAGDDHNRAIKVANEIRGQMIAQGEAWGPRYRIAYIGEGNS